jgi:hypothetical protein
MRRLRSFTLISMAMLALIACGPATFANDWSTEQCIVAKSVALSDTSDGESVAEYSVHCCEGEDEDGGVRGCRG